MAAMVTGMGLMGSGTASSRAMTIVERNREKYEAQRAARRGPTLEVFFTKHIDNSRIVKADDPERRREMRMFTMVLVVLFSLVMVYVWQHFSSIEMGYKIEAQKTQLLQLKEQNRELRLSEAELTEPARIDAIARQLGLGEPEPGQVIRSENAVSGAVMADASAGSGGGVGVLGQ